MQGLTELSQIAGLVRQSTSVAIKQLDAGYDDNPRFVDRPFKGEIVETPSETEAGEIVDLVAQLSNGEQMRCHLPHYSLLFQLPGYDDLEIAICFRCNNARTLHGATPGWFAFDSTTKAAKQLLARIQR